MKGCNAVMKIAKKKKSNRGFTLVEVLVAAAILSLVVTPILSSYVMIAKVNAQSRRKLSATSIANCVMESVKAFELADVAMQCNFPDIAGFHVVANSYDSVSETTGPSVTKDASNNLTFNTGSGTYSFKIEGVKMDGTTYDVYLTYTLNEWEDVTTTDASNNPTTMPSKDILSAMDIRVLYYYDVDIQVYRGGMTTKPLATLTGTKADYTPEATTP